jgi:hypothetical protein
MLKVVKNLVQTSVDMMLRCICGLVNQNNVNLEYIFYLQAGDTFMLLQELVRARFPQELEFL